jgi:hypothetical protein
MVMDGAMSGHLWTVAPEVVYGPEEIIRNNVSIYLHRGSPAARRTRGDAEQAGFRCRQGAERKK